MPSTRSKSSKKKTTKPPFNPMKYGPAALMCIIVLLVGFMLGIRFEQKPATFILSQQALTGSFRPSATASGTYTLTFIGVKPHTLIYMDQPQRVVGSWTNTDFVQRWGQGTGTVANAVLLSHSPVDGKEYSISVKLSNPVFNGYAGTLTYSATIDQTTTPQDLVPSADRHMDPFPEILRSPALFIDGMN